MERFPVSSLAVFLTALSMIGAGGLPQFGAPWNSCTTSSSTESRSPISWIGVAEVTAVAEKGRARGLRAKLVELLDD